MPSFSPIDFEILLKTKFNLNSFANFRFNIIEDIETIQHLIATNSENHHFLGVNLDNLYVAGGYFFKYNENAVYSRLLPNLFEDFRANQSIDFFCGVPIERQGILKYSINSLQVFTENHYLNNIKVTFNWSNQALPDGKTILDFFDSEFCKVAFNISDRKIYYSEWFYNPDYLKGIGTNTNALRQLKFKMKGYEHKNSEYKLLLNNLSKSF